MTWEKSIREARELRREAERQFAARARRGRRTAITAGATVALLLIAIGHLLLEAVGLT